MDKRSFDLTISFDQAEYLNPQLYLLVDTLKDNLPEDTIVHIVTNRTKNDEMRKYLKENLPCKIYYDSGVHTRELKSRCKYMLNCFRIKTDKPWVIKIEADLLFLKHLSSYKDLLREDLDLVMEPENRKIFDDVTEKRLWRNIYRNMEISMPTEKIRFRENDEEGLPLFGTGLVCVRSELLDTINKRWVGLTSRCEPWGNFNSHPNEMAWGGMVFDEKWRWELYPRKYKFNPIGIWRKGEFPSTDLIEDCVIPNDTVCLDWHRWPWLEHISKYNPSIYKMIESNKKYIPSNVWNMSTNISNKYGF